jgi:hypothetical protein
LAVRQKAEPNAWTTDNTQALLGTALLLQKKYAAAETLLLQGYDGLRRKAAKTPPAARTCQTETIAWLIKLYDAWGKNDKAEAWRKKLNATQPTGNH